LTDSDGTSYVGSFKNGEFNGHGIKTWNDGIIRAQVYENGTLISSEPL